MYFWMKFTDFHTREKPVIWYIFKIQIRKLILHGLTEKLDIGCSSDVFFLSPQDLKIVFIYLFIWMNGWANELLFYYIVSYQYIIVFV